MVSGSTVPSSPRNHAVVINKIPTSVNTFTISSTRPPVSRITQASSSPRSQCQLAVVGKSHLPQTTTPFVTVPTVYQMGGQGANHPVGIIQPGLHPVVMPTGPSQQPVVMLMSAGGTPASNFNIGGTANGEKGSQLQKLVTLPQGAKLQTVALSQQSQEHVASAKRPETPVEAIQIQVQENANVLPSRAMADSDSLAIENQLRMQIAHLQKQLLQSQLQRQGESSRTQGTGPSVSNPAVVYMQSPPTNNSVVSPSKVAIVTNAAQQQGALIGIIPSQGQTAIALQQPHLLPVLPSQITGYVKPQPAVSLAPIAQNFTQTQVVPTTNQITFMNSTPILGLPPGQTGSYIVPQFMVPGMPLVQSQGVTTQQILHMAPKPPSSAKS